MKNIFILGICFMFAGCSMIPSQTKPVEVRTISERPPMYHPPLPLEIQMVDVDWTVMTPQLMAEYLQALEEGSAPKSAYYSLTTKEYENLSMNMAEIKRYLQDTLHIIEFYREYDKDEDDDEQSQNND
jgi:hypothetical protein